MTTPRDRAGASDRAPRRRDEAPDFVPREVCYRCMRPARVCFCAHVPRLASPTRVLFLQHPREEFMPIGTARMAALCLEGAEVVVGVEVEGDPRVRDALDDPERTPILLWPGPGARDLAAEPPEGPVTLVVVDGTWSLAKKLVRSNPRVAALPRYALTPDRPSEYRIRAEPSEECVSTIEAVIQALGTIDRDRERYTAMMAPFRAMIDAQLALAAEEQGARARRKRPPRPRPVHPALRSGRPVVVVVGEASAWPYDADPKPDDALVQWVAVRLDPRDLTRLDDRFEAFARPTSELAPTATAHTRLPRVTIDAAPPFAELSRQFEAFVRPDDVVVSWSPYAPELFARQGGRLPELVDLRGAATAWLRDRTGSVAELVARLELAWTPVGQGRAGERLGQAAAVAAHLVAEGRAIVEPL